MSLFYTTNTIVHTVDLFPENIPTSLAGFAQWMGTRFEPRHDGKINKPPYRVRHGLPIVKADKTNPENWATFEEACETLTRGGADAIGFVFAEADPFSCVDIDGCRTEAGEIEPWALEHVEALPTYWEFSVSGKGLHAILEGQKPGEPCRRGDVEVYDQKRFLVVTGQHLKCTPTDIRRCQQDFNQLYAKVFGKQDATQCPPATPLGSSLQDDDLIERVIRSKHGAKFARLWQGDASGYESHSNADLALCGILAFWTGGDAAQIERLFSQSGLCRLKWTRRPDYRDRTITKALNGKTEFYSPPAMLRSKSKARRIFRRGR
jgi:putative DNA primase/helicase